MRRLLLFTRFWIASCLPATPSAADSPESYLAASFPAAITRVTVEKDGILIHGNTPETGRFLLAEAPIEASLGGEEPSAVPSPAQAVANGSFSLTLPRRIGGRDRFASRWRILRQNGDRLEAVSAARYAEEIFHPAPVPPIARPKSKKGLGGWTPDPFPDELDALGIDSVTVNLLLHTFVSLEPGPGTRPFIWQGKTYHARENELARHDKIFLHAAKRGAIVSAILLVANPARGGDDLVRLLGHPDARPEGVFAMPNLTSADGADLYGAILHLIAARWLAPGGEHGRIHHWIMHNEVDAGWEWTNAGEKSDIACMDLYHRSMRLMDLIARQHDPHSRVFISLTHHWEERGHPRWYGSRRMLDLLARFTAVEGDFPWALAFHPYPQDLFDPTAWDDDQASFTFHTAKITPRNLEVLDAYMKRSQLLHHGETRPVHLSENGFNSKDYSERSLAEQAAGMAFAWNKITALSSIECWHYHNRIDNRHEGGLRIGLRKFPDDPRDPAGRKPIWRLYQALGTDRESEVCAPYLDLIGINSWDRIRHRDPISEK